MRLLDRLERWNYAPCLCLEGENYYVADTRSEGLRFLQFQFAFIFCTLKIYFSSKRIQSFKLKTFSYVKREKSLSLTYENCFFSKVLAGKERFLRNPSWSIPSAFKLQRAPRSPSLPVIVTKCRKLNVIAYRPVLGKTQLVASPAIETEWAQLIRQRRFFKCHRIYALRFLGKCFASSFLDRMKSFFHVRADISTLLCLVAAASLMHKEFAREESRNTKSVIIHGKITLMHITPHCSAHILNMN